MLNFSLSAADFAGQQLTVLKEDVLVESDVFTSYTDEDGQVRDTIMHWCRPNFCHTLLLHAVPRHTLWACCQQHDPIAATLTLSRYLLRVVHRMKWITTKDDGEEIDLTVWTRYVVLWTLSQ